MASENPTPPPKTAAKTTDFHKWYTILIHKTTPLLHPTSLPGCPILRPWATAIWNSIRTIFTTTLSKYNVQEATFPFLLPSSSIPNADENPFVVQLLPTLLFASATGVAPLQEPLLLRPTSETAVLPAMRDWLQNGDEVLPLRVNQWGNAIRWERGALTPLIRGREFLWHEGHTATASELQCKHEAYTALSQYATFYEEVLAIPVVRGRKSHREKFPTADYSLTVEAFIPAAGRAVQGATSHGLGQHFSAMFDVGVDGGNGKGREIVWYGSYGMTTRCMGVLAMVHGDDEGVVLPPVVAPVQVVVIGGGEDGVGGEIAGVLRGGGIRVKIDVGRGVDDAVDDWRRKGVPLRILVNNGDWERGEVTMTRRVDESDIVVAQKGLAENVKKILSDIQSSMLASARKERDDCIKAVADWRAFVTAVDEEHGMAVAAWCGREECEGDVVERTSEVKEGDEGDCEKEGEDGLPKGVKTLCLPLEEELTRMGVKDVVEGKECFTGCGQAASCCALWGRSY